MELSIVPLREELLECTLEIERECSAVPWSYDSFLFTLHSPVSYCAAATADGVLAGYGTMSCLYEDAEILNLAVTPELRRMGIAFNLMKNLITEAKNRGAETVRLEVRQSNAAARALYEKAGFEYCGKRTGYYIKPREDALLMKLELTPEQSKINM